jgi:hypothetical protein
MGNNRKQQLAKQQQAHIGEIQKTHLRDLMYDQWRS